MKTWSVSPAGSWRRRRSPAAIAQNHTYGDGLYAVCDYLGQAHRDLRRDLDRCLDQARAAQSLPQ